MAEDKNITAHIIETGESAYAVEIDVSGYQITGDEPESFGGGGLGPAPYDLLVAALGECTAMTVRWYAKQQNWPLEKVEVALSYRKEHRQDIFTKRVTVYGDLLTDEQRNKLIEISAKCPVQRTLEGAPTIQTET